MKLELRSLHNDLLELEIEGVRPQLTICEILIDGTYHPWHTTWENIKINNFLETFDIVKNKIINYYKAETASFKQPSGVVARLPGIGKLITDDEEWELLNCKVVDTKLESIPYLELAFDGVKYKNRKIS